MVHLRLRRELWPAIVIVVQLLLLIILESSVDRTMDKLNSVLLSNDYPKSLLPRAAAGFDLDDYRRRFEKEGGASFVSTGAEVHFSDLDDAQRGFVNKTVTDDLELKRQLRIPNPRGTVDPICRYVFLEAPSSRDALKITRTMFSTLMTYLQVMPAFLDFVYSFRDQEYPIDFHFAAIRVEESLALTKWTNPIPALQRSDRGFQICYNLRSVEKVSISEKPWHIRQTAIASQYDTETFKSAWCILKANNKLRRKLDVQACSDRFSDSQPYNCAHGSFSAHLSTHVLVCEWARGRWALYITYLECKLQEQTRRYTLLSVDKTKLQGPAIRRLQRSRSTPLVTPKRRTTIIDDVRQQIRRAVTWRSSISSSMSGQNVELTETQAATSAPTDESEDCTFENLQDIHDLEEKINEVILIIKSNMNVIGELGVQVSGIAEHTDFPAVLRGDNCNLVPRFRSQLQSIVSDLRLQQARAETLLQLLSNRKAMLLSLIDYQTRVTTELLAEKSQQSADTMEKLTDDMRLIAKKTENETIFMRIVTVVTMFFLPGTFVSTLMSTDILRFDPERSFSGQALKYYLVITLPLMAVTFIVAYVFRGFEQRRVDFGWTTSDPEKGAK